MPKHLTANQILGEIGENAVRGRFLTLGFQFDGRSRLEAGIDGIAYFLIDKDTNGKAIFQVKSRKDPMTKENLSLYKKMIDDSFVMKDLKKYKDMPELLHIRSQNFFLTYPQLVSKAMQNFVRVDGTPKNEKEKSTLKSFVSARSWPGLFGDAFRLARAWR